MSRRTLAAAALAALLGLIGTHRAQAGQAPYGVAAPDIPISAHDRVYTADQYSNTVSVYNPQSETLLGLDLGEAAQQIRQARTLQDGRPALGEFL